MKTKQPKNQYIQIRVTPQEKKEIDDYFKNTRKKSETIRDLILSYVRLELKRWKKYE